MTVAYPLWFAILSAEFILFGMLVCKHVYGVLPILTVASALLCGLSLIGILFGLFSGIDLSDLLPAGILLRAVFWLCLMAEILRKLLRWNRALAPLVPLYLLLFAGNAIVLLLLACWRLPTAFVPPQRNVLYAVQGAGIVQMAAFLAMVWWAALRQFVWSRMEFVLATGIGLQSLVCLASGAALACPLVRQNDLLVWVPELVYLLVLLRWIHFFLWECVPAEAGRRRSRARLSEGLSHTQKFGS